MTDYIRQIIDLNT